MTRRHTIGRSKLSFAVITLAALSGFTFGGTGAAVAYVGNSYLQIPDMPGGWQGQHYTDWVKIDANYWNVKANLQAGYGRDHTSYAGPIAPREGEGEIVIALDKSNSILPRLMDACLQKTTFPELTYAESSMRARGPFEWGPRPAEIPEFYEYRLTNAVFSECPVVADAPQQAIIVRFADIKWLNYEPDAGDKAVDIAMEPAKLGPTDDHGRTKSFVLTWFAPAHDVSDDQCPVMNEKPSQDLYYAYMSKNEAEKERAQLGESGVSYETGQMGLRGPLKLSVTRLPGIVPDPINAAPQTMLARGLDLDGDDGSGQPPAGICKHKNYVSEDGRAGIDNQIYTVQGCIAGWQGHKGFIHQFANNSMRDGQYSMLIEISGIDNEVNDDSVEITWLFSKDVMVKSGAGTQVLPDYTFRVSEDPEYAHYFSRSPGRIVDGVVVTNTIDYFQLVLGIFGSPMELKLSNARMRLKLASDGTIKGVLGGYRDWRKMASQQVSSTTEQYFRFQVPAYYNALKREADGMKNPVTGECDGISTAYDIEGIPAFIAPAQSKALMKQAQAETPELETQVEKVH